MTEPAAENTRRLWWVVMAGVMLLAAGVRFAGLTEREMWFDESCTLYAVHHLFDWPPDGPDPQHELAHPPYFFLLHLWTRLAGETTWGLRSFSALIGCTAVMVIGWFATRVGGRAVGLISAILAALHPLHVYYSQEARVYTLWSLAVTFCVYSLYQAGRTLRTRRWIIYGVAVWLTVLTHYYTLLWLPGTVAAVLIAPDRNRFLRRWVVTHAALALALLPVLWLMIVPLAEGGPKPWLRETWLGYPPLLAVPKSLWALLPSGGYPSYLGALTVAAEEVSRRLGAVFGMVVLWGPVVLLVGVILRWAVVWTPGRRIDGPQNCPDKELNQPLPHPLRRRRLRLASSGVEDGSDQGRPIPDAHSPEAGASRDLVRCTVFLLVLSLSFLLVAFGYSWIAEPIYLVGRYDLAAWPSLVVGMGLLIHLSGWARVRRGTVSGQPLPHPLRRRRLASSGVKGGSDRVDGRGADQADGCGEDLHEGPGPPGLVPAGVKHAFIGGVITAALAGCSLMTLFGARSVPVSNDLTDRARRIATTVGPDDLVVSLAMYRWFMTYEWHQLGFAAQVISFPPNHDRQLCWYDAEAELADSARIATAVETVTGQIDRALRQGRAVWLLWHGEPTGPRWEVDKNLFARLRERHIAVVPVDEPLGLARLVRSGESAGMSP